MKKRKIAVLAALFAVAAYGWNFVDFAESANKSYYTGDAISYRDQVIVGSTNMGYAELFRQESGELVRVATIKDLSKEMVGVNKGKGFYDIMFNEENGRLFAYLVNGRFFYKYDVTNLSSPELVRTAKDNSWDWFLGLDKFDDRIVTVGTKGVKIWSQGMVVIDSFKVKYNYSANNLTISQDGRYLLNASSTDLEIFDTVSRRVEKKIAIQAVENHNRTPYMGKSGIAYIADDNRVRAFDINGNQIASYDHKSTQGYDVQIGPSSGSLYASDGIGILKLDPRTLKELDWKHTASLGASNGWSMGMRVVSTGGKDKVVVFNNSAILVMDDKLDLVASYKSTEEAPVEEDLNLTLDKHSGMPGFNVLVSGTGFGPNEELDIFFGSQKNRLESDKYGRFVTTLTVPDMQKGMIDIKVKGFKSGLTYSTNFNIIK